MTDDIDLWRRFVEGDESAADELYERYKDFVFMYCLRRVASYHAAEDLLQEVYLELWRRRKILVLHAHGVRPMLAVIAYGHTSNHRRWWSRQKDVWRLMPPENTADPADDVAARIDAERKAAEFLEKLSRLTRAEQDAVEACLWLGLTAEAAADVLGIGVAALRSRLHRAKEKLRRLGVELDSEET